MRALHVAALCAALGCKAKSEEAKPAPAPTPVEKAIPVLGDPSFVKVDRDQLAALCVATHLPRPISGRYDTGALVLADGTRLPWVAFWVNEDEPKVVGAKDWTARAKATLEDLMSRTDSPPERAPADARRPETLFRLCDDTEVFYTAITGVFLAKGKAHLIAMRGKQLLEVDASSDDAFPRAFALTEKLLGQTATVARHKLGPASDEGQATIDDDRWLPAKKK